MIRIDISGLQNELLLACHKTWISYLDMVCLMSCALRALANWTGCNVRQGTISSESNTPHNFDMIKALVIRCPYLYGLHYCLIEGRFSIIVCNLVSPFFNAWNAISSGVGFHNRVVIFFMNVSLYCVLRNLYYWGLCLWF